MSTKMCYAPHMVIFSVLKENLSFLIGHFWEIFWPQNLKGDSKLFWEREKIELGLTCQLLGNNFLKISLSILSATMKPDGERHHLGAGDPWRRSGLWLLAERFTLYSVKEDEHIKFLYLVSTWPFRAVSCVSPSGAKRIPTYCQIVLLDLSCCSNLFSLMSSISRLRPCSKMTLALAGTVVGSGSDKSRNVGREIIHCNGTREASGPSFSSPDDHSVMHSE